MNPIKLYRLLQQYVGEINNLVVGLYGDSINADTARADAIAKTKELLALLEADA